MHHEPIVLSQILFFIFSIFVLGGFGFLLLLINGFIKHTTVKGGSTFLDDLDKQ